MDNIIFDKTLYSTQKFWLAEFTNDKVNWNPTAYKEFENKEEAESANRVMKLELQNPHLIFRVVKMQIDKEFFYD